MSNRIIEIQESSTREKVAANSTVINVGDFVTLSGGFITNASTTAKIVGVSNLTKTFTADNQTVAKAKLSYTIAPNPFALYQVVISGGTITSADEGKFYALGANGYTVDGTTESTTTGTLKLEKFVTSTKGQFSVVA